ncbi:MAG: chorismate-binding protein [Kineosporiaceae bacterium]
MPGEVPIGRAWFAGVLAEGPVEASTDPRRLDGGGWWAVVVTFEGEARLWRFARTTPAPVPPTGPSDTSWAGPAPNEWTTSLDADAYRRGVQEVRRRIREGDVYQVNLCRVLSAPVPDTADPWALADVLRRGNPAPYAGVVDVPDLDGVPGLRLVSASPELFLRREPDPDDPAESILTSAPIKGTAPTPGGLLPKDTAENVMITDLVRNDLQRVCRPGSVEVTGLLQVEHHPGLVHLVSTVRGRLRGDARWADVLAATTPPGSVSGAPKSSALRAIADLEPVPRGPYCGAVGWVDADRGRACLAVGIRTFWWDRGRLRFGTGAGITWGSDAEGEWRETELKAGRLLALTSSSLADEPGLAGSAGPDGLVEVR